MGMQRGVVEAKSNKFGKTSILVNGNWFGSKYGFSCEKGDEVEFDDMGGKMVKGLKVLSSGGGSSSSTPSRSSGYSPKVAGFPVPVDTKDRAIVRQNSLGHAVALVKSLVDVSSLEYESWEVREKATEQFALLAVDIARIFENYSSGDGDAEEARAELED